MADTEVIVMGSGPIKSAAGLHGQDIGYVYGGYNVQLDVDFTLEHDGWLPITSPNPWPGKQNPEHLQGWIKKSRVAVLAPDKFIYRVEIDKQTGQAVWTLVGE